MRIAKNSTGQILRNSLGKVIKFKPDDYVEPIPEALQFEIVVDEGQTFVMPTPNSFYYYDTNGTYRSSGTLTYNYFVDWGDGTPVANITSYNSADASHVYEKAGKYIIVITSPTQEMPCFDFSYSPSTSSRNQVTRVFSWGDLGLKYISFYYCQALTQLPEQIGKLESLWSAYRMFFYCTSLSSVPYGLFFSQDQVSDIQCGDFRQLFYYCTSIRVIHSSLFQNAGSAWSFYEAFRNCTSLSYIPAGLFDSCPNAKNFQMTFGYCYALTEIPENLFMNCTLADVFTQTFYQCQNLEIIPANLWQNATTQVSFNSTFYNTKIVSIPASLFSNVYASTFAATFYACDYLESIPATLFAGQINCTSFQSCFYSCNKLAQIPAGLFDVGAGNSCTSMASCFYQCGLDASITEFIVPAGLFDQLVNVTSFSNVFRYCSKFKSIPVDLFKYNTQVTDFSWAFGNNDHISIPVGLFSTCTEVTNFQGVFYSNTNLTSAGLPADTFANCSKVIYFGYSDQYIYDYGAFSRCSSLTYIPAGLFDSCVNVQSFNAVFYGCTNLTTIPVDLFRYCTVVTNFIQSFRNTAITETTANIFQYNRSVTRMDYVFADCTQLVTVHEDTFNTNNSQSNAIVDFSYSFYNCTNVNLVIPANLFRYSINARIFNRTFYQCNIAIPAGLFANNLLIESFEYCFAYNYAITAIPNTLFVGLTQVSNMNYCFYHCTELLEIPADLMNDIGSTRSVTFNYCFALANTAASNTMVNAVPELWLKANNPTGLYCFRYRTAVSNYADIPADWK